MEWIKNSGTERGVPIKSWCKYIEDSALEQAENLANHPVIKLHVALMPDCHVGYGMPIGGVIACENAVIPNAVGVDIGCGMIAVETDIPTGKFHDMEKRRELLDSLKPFIPLGEGHAHREKQTWEGFTKYLDTVTKQNSGNWPDDLDRRNLGSLGGGNHFIELQKSEDNKIWLMIHSGSRNLGHKIARYYCKLAQDFNAKQNIKIPNKDLAFLYTDTFHGQNYIRDMNFALDYALENRQRMMNIFKDMLYKLMKGKFSFLQEVNIHHNYAAKEKHFQKQYWVHRKGATSAKAGEIGIIPGSMGTTSYIVAGKGNPESFMSCSHGAGRKMGRNQANNILDLEICNKAMEGIVYDRWKKAGLKWGKKKNKNDKYDLSEAPLAYKNIDNVIKAELDLIEPTVKLEPLGVIKG